MKLFIKILVLAAVGSSFWYPSAAQVKYNDYEATLLKIGVMAKEYPSLCTVKTLVKTQGGKEIMVLTIGTGDKDKKPAIAIVGGVEGPYIIGKELTLGFAETLLRESASPEIQSLLEKLTFYIFPDLSPDATEQFFQKLKYERSVNARSVDDDRDFVLNEDPPEDLDNDGLITYIRVSDPAGIFTESTEDKRVMVTADLSKGEKGSYFVYSEGTDNDKDGRFNEDGEGGVNFNRNLSYNYEEFGTNSGLHPVSEPETKAVLDFLFDHFNIYAVFTFGPQDNLNQSGPTGDRASRNQSPGQEQSSGQGQGQFQGPGTPQGSGQMERTGDRKITTIQRSDETIIKLVSDKYREITGVKGNPQSKAAAGNFADWVYYHYGRYSFSTPAWWVPFERGKNAEVEFLKYAGENKMDNVFVPWKEIKHPDFPGKKTEAGGIKPFAMINPPEGKLEELIDGNYKFITAVAAMHPDLEFIDIVTEDKGDNIYRISLKIHNKGIFATCTEAGQNNMWTRIMRLNFEPDKGQSLLSGQKVQRISRLTGNGSAEFSWLVMGKGNVKISAGAVNTGTVTTSVELK